MAAAQQLIAAGTLVSGITGGLRRLGQRVTADDLRAEAAAAAAHKGGGSGRSSVTLADLVTAGLIAPCSGCITVSYKNQTWTADLAADGAIEFEGQRFTSTTAFSIHCKRKITPGKQADDGWKSVFYRGQPLADFRAAFEPKAPRPAAGGSGAAAAAAQAALAPTRVSGRQRKKKRFDSDSEGDAHAAGALTDEAYAMLLSAAEHQARQAQQAQQAAKQAAKQAAQQAPQEVVVELPAGVEVPDAERWVQCDRCQEWRVVPAENWQAVQEDPREEWYCEYAAWDVAKQPPHKPACKKRGGGGRRGARK